MSTSRTARMGAGLIVLMFCGVSSFAHSNRSRELCGTIISLDLVTKRIEVKSERSGNVRDFLLRRDTAVLQDWKRSNLDAITQRVRARVYYRSPFFGKPFVRKLVILNDGEGGSQLRGGLFDRH